MNSNSVANNDAWNANRRAQWNEPNHIINDSWSVYEGIKGRAHSRSMAAEMTPRSRLLQSLRHSEQTESVLYCTWQPSCDTERGSSIRYGRREGKVTGTCRSRKLCQCSVTTQCSHGTTSFVSKVHTVRKQRGPSIHADLASPRQLVQYGTVLYVLSGPVLSCPALCTR